MKTYPENPVFPITREHDLYHMQGLGHGVGITIREYYAGLAMQSLIETHLKIAYNKNRLPSREGAKLVAEWAWKYADAMIEESG
jgi:hypothetical protein